MNSLMLAHMPEVMDHLVELGKEKGTQNATHNPFVPDHDESLDDIIPDFGRQPNNEYAPEDVLLTPYDS
jgi:hypothetical protein